MRLPKGESVMAIAERLVARVGFTLKPTGPERGTSKVESSKEGVFRGDGRGCRRGNVVSHNAPAFPCLEDSTLEKLEQASASRPREASNDFRLRRSSANPRSPLARPSPYTLPRKGNSLRYPLPPWVALLSRSARATSFASRSRAGASLSPFGRAGFSASRSRGSGRGAFRTPSPSHLPPKTYAFKSAYTPLDLGWRASSVHSTSTWPLRESPVLASFSSVNPRR